jgi:hypothetical protein
MGLVDFRADAERRSPDDSVRFRPVVVAAGSAQLTQIRAYREKFAGPGRPRVVVGRVIVPLDGAGDATRRKYREYQASRHQRTLTPQGERRILIAPDLVGTSAEIAESLLADPVLAETTELQLELPYAFEHQEYEQILSDVAASIAPRLGWSPSGRLGRARRSTVQHFAPPAGRRGSRRDLRWHRRDGSGGRARIGHRRGSGVRIWLRRSRFGHLPTFRFG